MPKSSIGRGRRRRGWVGACVGRSSGRTPRYCETALRTHADVRTEHGAFAAFPRTTRTHVRYATDVSDLSPEEAEILRRSVAMLPPGAPSGLSREKVLANLPDSPTEPESATLFFACVCRHLLPFAVTPRRHDVWRRRYGSVTIDAIGVDAAFRVETLIRQLK